MKGSSIQREDENRANYYVPKGDVNGGAGCVLRFFCQRKFFILSGEIDDRLDGGVQTFRYQECEKVDDQKQKLPSPSEYP
jgi:hypothetical protein